MTDPNPTPTGQDEARRALKAEIKSLCCIVWEDMRRQAIAACDAEIQTIADLGQNAGTCAGYGRVTASNIALRIRALPVPADLNDGGGEVSELLKLIIVDSFAIVGAIAATRWLWRLLDAAEARCLIALAQQAKGEGEGGGSDG